MSNVSDIVPSSSLVTARWGRCQEGYGEDPYLQAELGTQYVMGLQNGSSEQYYEAIVSTCIALLVLAIGQGKGA